MMGYPQVETSREAKSLRAVLTDLSMRFEDMRLLAVKSEDELNDKARAYLSEANRMNEENSDLRLELRTTKEYAKSCERKAGASIVAMITSYIAMLVMVIYFFIQLIQ